VTRSLADTLLAELRHRLALPMLDYAETPHALGGGFDTEVFAFQLTRAPSDWSEPLVLRAFRPEPRFAERARIEACAHACVAAHGVPAPRVLSLVDGANELGRPYLVMARAPGERLIDWLRSSAALRVPGWLADAQLALHALDASHFEQALAAVGVDPKTRSAESERARLASEVTRLGLDGLRAGAAWLVSAQPEPRSRVICHGDYHPLNVLADGKRVTGVIDWANVCVSEAEHDVGTTRALLTEGPLAIAPWLAPIARAARRALAAIYLARYRRARPLDEMRVRYYEAQRLFEALVEVGEERQAELERCPRPSRPAPFAGPAVVASVSARFAALSGVRITLP
jgi:aminoglycoside phosphotransferase (APT) family kinase protein